MAVKAVRSRSPAPRRSGPPRNKAPPPRRPKRGSIGGVKGAGGGQVGGLVPLPARGVGYITYNRERDGADQWGTPRTVHLIQALGRLWHERDPTRRPIEIGDISRPRGGWFPPHATHRAGNDFDVRPPTEQGGAATWRSKGYDREATRAFVALVKQLVPEAVVYFNDRVLVLDGTTDSSAGHDNHLHVSLPERTED